MDEDENLGASEALKREGTRVIDDFYGAELSYLVDCLPAENFTRERKKAFHPI